LALVLEPALVLVSALVLEPALVLVSALVLELATEELWFPVTIAHTVHSSTQSTGRRPGWAREQSEPNSPTWYSPPH